MARKKGPPPRKKQRLALSGIGVYFSLMRKPAIIAAFIAAAAAIIAALIGIYPTLRNKTTEAPTVLAGTVVVADTNRAVGQATIVITGRAEQAVTDDNGGFRIDIPVGAPRQLRLRVSKPGFQTLDTTVAPAENLVLPLLSLRK
jgi:hypothetical protein